MTQFCSPKPQTHYALQRRSDGAWLRIGYDIVEVTQKPIAMCRLETARRHRMMAMLKNADEQIDIREVVISSEIKSTLAEKNSVRDKMKELTAVVKPYFARRTWRTDCVFDRLVNVETLMMQKSQEFRYVAFLIDGEIQTRENVAEWRKTIKFAYKNGVFLISTANDLVWLRIVGFTAEFIYDFDTKTTTFDPPLR